MGGLADCDDVLQFEFSHITHVGWPLTPSNTVCLIAAQTILGHSVVLLFCIVHIVLTNLP